MAKLLAQNTFLLDFFLSQVASLYFPGSPAVNVAI